MRQREPCRSPANSLSACLESCSTSRAAVVIFSLCSEAACEYKSDYADLITIVVVSSYFLKRLGFKRWRKLHYLAYVAIPVLVVHGVITDPALRDQPIDFLDAEKLLVEGAALLFLVAVLMRLRLRGRKPKARGKRSHAVAMVLVLGILIVPVGASADGSASDGPTQGWSLDPDAGAVWTRGGWT